MSKIRDLSVGRGGDVMYFDPDTLKEFENYNVRNYDSQEVKDHIRTMANSIKENGILSFQPITVMKVEDEVFIVSGHCRKKAFSLAKSEGADIKGIPATVVPSSMTEQARVLDLLNSNSGLPLTMLEKAEVVKRLLNFGWTVGDIAKKHGVSIPAINNLITLQEAPESIKSMVSEGVVSPTLALETVVQQGPEKAEQTLVEVVQVAKEKGKKKVTNKDMKASGKGLSMYTGKSKLPDLFVEDPDVGIFPCGFCINRTDLEVCRGCKHYVELGDE